MKRHVLFTGAIGSGKSTALARTLALMDVKAQGIQTYSPQPRGMLPKQLYLRAYGSEEEGALLCVLPGGDRSGVAAVFDDLGSALLEDAKARADVIVVDEIGHLEHSAAAYRRALCACLDGCRPVAGVIRRDKAAWADFIRSREDVLLVEVTADNRDALPAQAAKTLLAALGRHK